MRKVLLVVLLAVLLEGGEGRRRTHEHGAEVAAFVRSRRNEYIAVLFRTHVADNLSRRVFSGLERSLAENDGYSLYCVYDADVLSSQVVAAAFGSNAKLIGSSLASLLDRYPKIEPRRQIIKSHYQYLAFAAAANQLHAKYEKFWCLEHDVALTKSQWFNLFAFHDKHYQHDLLSWQVGWTPKIDKVHGGGSWNSRMLYGPATAHVRPADVAFSFGPIVRFSIKLLSLLDTIATTETPSYGHAETFVPTLCNISEWCSFQNLSDAWVGQLSYQLPISITANVFAQLEHIAPDRLFHPVRDTASASSATAVEKLSTSTLRKPNSDLTPLRPLEPSDSTKEKNLAPTDWTQSRVIAECLQKNPRPIRPSYNCPLGCPHFLQDTCPEVNCLWAQPETHKYVHLAVDKCIQLCRKRPSGCPYYTAVDIMT